MYATYTRLHIDLDSFFLSVELRDRPCWRGKACAVAGQPGTRSVILSASYEARRFGIRAGMAVEHAFRLCPHLLLVPPRHDLYSQVSREIMAELSRFSPDYAVESIDEMSMDVSRVLSLRGHAVQIARTIMKDIPEKFGLTCSVGVSPNRLLAKFASDLQKPSGMTVLGPSCFVRLTENMEVKRLHGVGPQTATALSALGLGTIGLLRQAPRGLLREKFGKTGDSLWNSCRGLEQEENPERGRDRSLGRELTLPEDTSERERILPILLSLAEDLCTRLRREELTARTVTLKVKHFDFRLVTRRSTLKKGTNLETNIYTTAKSLLEGMPVRPIRLVGITLSSLTGREDEEDQPLLFTEAVNTREKKEERIAEASDRLKERFGPAIVRRASTLRHNPKEHED